MRTGYSCRAWWLLAALLTQFFPGRAVGIAYTPEHPDVQAMVGQALNYLEGLAGREIDGGHLGGTEYHAVLVAYAHLRARGDLSVPVVQRGLQRAVEFATGSGTRGSSFSGRANHTEKNNYGDSVCILLLCEAGSDQFGSEIRRLRDRMLRRQQSGGGFGYPGDQRGDVSQTQYVVLAMWAMQQHGIDIDASAVDRAQHWLMRVQDIDGSWPYHANDPGPGSALISQGTRQTHSTSLAGGGSILIAGDFFGFWHEAKQVASVLPGMPKAIRLATESNAISARDYSPKVRPRQVLNAVDRMNEFRQARPYRRGGSSSWHYYQLYSTERFESFLEHARGTLTPEPAWYNDGVEALKRNQSKSGGWGIDDVSASPPVVATSFGILFLIRSTRQSIAGINTGSLAGGHGLPKDTTEISVQGTRIVGRPVAAAVTELLELLENDDADALSGQSIPEDLRLATDRQQLASQLDRLERLVRGSQSWQARRVAARLLARSDQSRVAPALIYALSDPDRSVRLYARDGLRFLSRKFDGFGMPDDPSPNQIDQAQQQWRQWYLTVNPTYVFIDAN